MTVPSNDDILALLDNLDSSIADDLSRRLKKWSGDDGFLTVEGSASRTKY